MTKTLPLVASVFILAVITPAFAQGETSRPAVGIGSKTMESCKADTQKFCSKASDYMRNECLVKNWTRISSDCQDAVALPGRGGGGGGD